MTNFESVLVVSGLAFLFIAFLGAGSIRTRTVAFVVGLLLIGVGIAIHTEWLPSNKQIQAPTPIKIPTVAPSPIKTPTIAPTPIKTLTVAPTP